MPKVASDRMPFFVRQVGLDYSIEKGAIIGFETANEAQVDCDDRNDRAEKMGVKARYETIAQ